MMEKTLSPKRFYGVYRGVCIDSQDPDEMGRITLQVPQVLGSAVSNWAPNMGGQLSQYKVPYGTFLTNADQLIGVNTATIVSGSWEAVDTNSCYLSSDRIYVEETGDYFTQFSAMLIKTNASAGTADIWIRKNGNDIEKSNTRITLSGSNAEITMTVGFILDLDAGDYIQFVSSASATNTYLSSSPAGTGPAIPGMIVTLNLIGKYKPKPGTPVWVSFIDGDPNFPVWIGAY